MTDSQVHHLGKTQMLEIIRSQEAEIVSLEKRVQELEEEVQASLNAGKETGSLAQAALQMSGVFEAAQKAADIYLEAIRARAATEQDTAESVDGKTEESEQDGKRNTRKE